MTDAYCSPPASSIKFPPTLVSRLRCYARKKPSRPGRICLGCTLGDGHCYPSPTAQKDVGARSAPSEVVQPTLVVTRRSRDLARSPAKHSTQTPDIRPVKGRFEAPPSRMVSHLPLRAY